MEIQLHEKANLQRHLRDYVIVNKDFKAVIIDIVYNLGIKEVPDLRDLDRLFLFLQKHFPTTTIEKIVESVELYKASKLDFADPKFGHYGNFSQEFLGKVLTAYDLRELKLSRQKPHKALKEGITTDSPEKVQQGAYNHVKEIFLSDTPRKCQFPEIMLADWLGAGNYLVNKRLLLPDNKEETRTRSRKWKQILISREKKKSSQTSMKVILTKITSYGIKRECVKEIVQEWFVNNKDNLV